MTEIGNHEPETLGREADRASEDYAHLNTAAIGARFTQYLGAGATAWAYSALGGADQIQGIVPRMLFGFPAGVAVLAKFAGDHFRSKATAAATTESMLRADQRMGIKEAADAGRASDQRFYSRQAGSEPAPDAAPPAPPSSPPDTT